MKSLREVDNDEIDGCECYMQWGLLVTNLPVMLIGLGMVVLSTWTMSEKTYLDALQTESGSIYSVLLVLMLIAGIRSINIQCSK